MTTGIPATTSGGPWQQSNACVHGEPNKQHFASFVPFSKQNKSLSNR
jgi:hypothetical protein